MVTRHQRNLGMSMRVENVGVDAVKAKLAAKKRARALAKQGPQVYVHSRTAHQTYTLVHTLVLTRTPFTRIDFNLYLSPLMYVRAGRPLYIAGMITRPQWRARWTRKRKRSKGGVQRRRGEKSYRDSAGSLRPPPYKGARSNPSVTSRCGSLLDLCSY